MAQNIGRWGLRVPDGTDGPPDVPLWLNRLATDLSDVAKDNQGTLAARPVSTALSPGIAGRYYTTTNETGGRKTYRDHGTGWDQVVLGADARLSDQRPPRGPEAGLGVIRGAVAANGQVVRGSGFTVIKGVAGIYTVDFPVSFQAVPSTVASGIGVGVIATINSPQTANVGIRTSVGTVLQDAPFEFIAIGPRQP